MHQAIAILDSGVGGLTVAKEVMRQLPQEEIVYFGDTGRAPYGPRAPDEVLKFTEQIVEYLLQFQPKMIVIACNTATAIALKHVRSQVNIPVVGVIQPGSRAAIKATKTGMIGVIGTENTVTSGAYPRALQELNPDTSVVSLACPALVPLVEKRLYRSDMARTVVSQSLQPLLNSPIDCLILGCTHYPFLAQMIAETVGPRVSIISSADETAREISTLLHHRGQLETSGKVPVHRFFCSGDPETFQAIALEWLGEQIKVSPVFWQMTRLSR
ncbi:glutamate racemase [Paenibacillus ginsengarvi]|uniref:Glutamate racemase n=1 Tax=Paenibacillus ginsengarvi TaxID=400777 RepID=A0A3B0CN91_9BACL|nr:glutamate racemase [Paenibacillus ginsengarvi]RKN85416.1 glutamate racemase [Paenibacillus ginsengarvi]